MGVPLGTPPQTIMSMATPHQGPHPGTPSSSPHSRMLIPIMEAPQWETPQCGPIPALCPPNKYFLTPPWVLLTILRGWGYWGSLGGPARVDIMGVTTWGMGGVRGGGLGGTSGESGGSRGGDGGLGEPLGGLWS